MSGRSTWCKHYRGMHKKETCEAGVSFNSLPNYGTQNFMETSPCFSSCGGCDKAEYLTPEEIKADEAKMKFRFASMIKAREAIVEACGGQWKRGTPGSSGVIDCPVCLEKKSLRYSRAGSNGHIHAACSTISCVNWME